MKKLVIATGNKDKVSEIKDILSDMKLEILSKDEVGLAELDIIEDADTLRGNAILKASAVLKNCDADLVLADDTGLYVDYLNGAPGVHTARYAGEDADYADNRKKLLRELEGVSDSEREAKFITSIVILSKDSEYDAMGVCEGSIAKEEIGNLGFGYDPIFIPKGYDRTFAELSTEIKNKISHRALALNQLRELLEDIGVDKHD